LLLYFPRQFMELWGTRQNGGLTRFWDSDNSEETVVNRN
jgi:hypothetical protein